MTYFTADLHLGHKNVINHYKRPFSSIEEHDYALIDFCCSIPSGSDLWFLGDVAFSTKRLGLLLDRLAEKRIAAHLIRGNHDDKFAWKFRSRFASAHEALYLRRNVGDEVINLYLSHYSHQVWRGSNRGAYHLFGHSHGNLQGIGRSMDVGVNCNDYVPVSIKSVIEKLSEKPLTDHHETR